MSEENNKIHGNLKKILYCHEYKFELCPNVAEPNFPSYYLANFLKVSVLIDSGIHFLNN